MGNRGRMAMKELAGRIAVVTGGGSGMGRELVRLLAAEACNVAMCDVTPAGMAETRQLCEAAGLAQGLRVTTHIADVSDPAQVARFCDEVAHAHATDRIHLLFNNAGVGGGGSMVVHSREEWERTFNICWGGVYNCTRAFLPMLLKAEAGHIVNTSSVNGFWASVGPRVPHTAYAAAKFAVKGFAEALTAAEIAQARARIASMGRDVSRLSDDDIRKLIAERDRRFREEAPTSAAAAAKIILDGVKAERWRILVGPDAEIIDRMVRADPERAYEEAFFEEFAQQAGWRLGS